MSPISNFSRTALACTVVALLGGCVIASDVRLPAMAPIQPIMPPQAAPPGRSMPPARPCSCIQTAAHAMSATC